MSKVLISWTSDPTWKTARYLNLQDQNSTLTFPEIARKIASYSDDSKIRSSGSTPRPDYSPETKKGVTPPLHVVEAFLFALASPSDGEVSFNVQTAVITSLQTDASY